jgi:hypothetical protein
VAAFTPGTLAVDNNGDPKIPNEQATIPLTVRDSINDNHMQAFNTDTAPKYVNYNLPPTSLKSGQPNLMAWEVDGTSTGGRDVYTINRNIQNGIVGGMYDSNGATEGGIIPSTTTGFTLEAAFNVSDFNSFHAIVAKEGRPGSVPEIGGDPNLPTLALKVRGALFEGDPNQGKLQIELFDGAGNLKSVTTDESLNVGSWYYAAVVNDGQTMSLYLDSNDGQGYLLVGSQAVAGALFQGANYNNASWNHNWTIGRAIFGGAGSGTPSDWFNGLIDEVRLSNEALDPSEFLFAQESIGLDGDFNGDEVVDGLDVLTWQRGETDPALSPTLLQDWKDNFGAGAPAAAAAAAVPEPASLALSAMVFAASVLIRRRSR